MAGTGTSIVVGGITGRIAAAGVVGAPETGGVSLVLIPAAVALDVGAAKIIDAVQNVIYTELNIK